MLYKATLAPVASRNVFERDFTIELKLFEGLMEYWIKCQISPPPPPHTHTLSLNIVKTKTKTFLAYIDCCLILSLSPNAYIHIYQTYIHIYQTQHKLIRSLPVFTYIYKPFFLQYYSHVFSININSSWSLLSSNVTVCYLR